MKQLTALALSLVAYLGLPATTERPISDHPLAWMAGHWSGQGLGGTVDESWMPSAGGAMLGTFRLIQDGEVKFYELMTIENRPSGLVMSLKHFDPDLTSWEAKDEARVWPGEMLEDGVMRFGPVEYQRNKENGMVVRVEVTKGTETSQQVLTYTRHG